MVKKGISLKKIWLIVLLAVGMIACTEQNTPTDPGTSTGTDSTETVTPMDTTITTTDTISITWSGQSADVEGSHTGVEITTENGYVTVNSTVKDITYMLSGTGQGQMSLLSRPPVPMLLRWSFPVPLSPPFINPSPLPERLSSMAWAITRLPIAAVRLSASRPTAEVTPAAVEDVPGDGKFDI